MIAFLLVGAAAVAAAIGVISARSPVHSVLWLIVHLCSLAVLYMTLQAEFLGLVQILLYAGAVMVLFLFVLGLISARTPGEAPGGQQPRGQIGFAVAAVIVIAGVLLVGAVGGALAPAASALSTGFGSAEAFGQALFGPYLLPFESTALALLTAIVATVALSSGHDEAVRRALPAEVPAGAPIDVSHAALAAEPELAGRSKP